MMIIDKIDQKILTILQENDNASVAEIGKVVGLSTTPCWRRIQRMENEGIIKKKVSLLDRKKLGFSVVVFVDITVPSHSKEWINKLHEVANEFDEIVELYRMAGKVDYLMKVVVPSISKFDEFYKQIIKKIDLSEISSHFAMEEIKYKTTMPLKYISEAKN